ncbi:MAG: glycosyltransferase family 2 protein [Clostridia bacterium]|nr:glycosyltransferase family 2 protein [Clostridia bacterium]
MSLSVCLIVKNEEAVIGRCLNCVCKFADEIIVVDTGSTDNTVEEVKKFTDNVCFFRWCDDFSAARNFSLEKAEGDYVMWLDADDVITDENCKKIRELVEGADFDMAFLPYAAAFDGDAPTFVYYRERIFKRSKNYRFSGAVHEAVAPEGNIVYSDAAVYHKKVKNGEPLRNLSIYQSRIAKGICLDERSEFYYGRELLYAGMYRESIAVLEHFLNGGGWAENKLEACLNVYRAYTAIGDKKNAMDYLLRSFLFAPPRSEACCILGEYFAEQNDVKSAIYWYQNALSCNNAEKEGGFVNLDYGGFIPDIQLCVLYDKLGDFERANAYNEAAGAIKPHSESYLYNKRYFENKLKKEV